MTKITRSELAKTAVIVVAIVAPTLIIVGSSSLSWPVRLVVIAASSITIGTVAIVVLRRMTKG